jgi:hypothetical protein
MDFDEFYKLHLVKKFTVTPMKKIRTAYLAYRLKHKKEEQTDVDVLYIVQQEWSQIVKKYGFLKLPFVMIGKKVNWRSL